MEDQGKRLLIAVAIAFVVMVVWTTLFPPEQTKEAEKKPEPTEQSQPGTTANSDGTTGPAPAGAAEQPGATAEVKKPRGPAQETVFEFPKFRATFSTHGAGIKKWELLEPKFLNWNTDQPRDLAPAAVAVGDASNLPDDLLVMTVDFDGDSTHKLGKVDWKIESVNNSGDNQNIVFVATTDALEVRKTFTFRNPDDYLVALAVSVKQLAQGDAKQAIRISSTHFQDPEADTGAGWVSVGHEWRTACFMAGESNTNSSKYLLEKGPRTYSGNAGWAGVTHSYFLSAFAPKRDGQSYSHSRCVAKPAVGARAGTLRTDLTLGPPVDLKQGQKHSWEFVGYLGPKYLSQLEAIPGKVGWDAKFEGAVDLGFFSFIARPLLWLLKWFQSLVVNWGLAIILLTLVVKAATLYWTTKSMRSMRRMSALNPEVTKIREKYKDDRQRTQMEIMNLYKTNNVNMLSGCLPMLLQMPIWFALYSMLRVAAELYQAPFIPGWVDDLTAPDPLYILPIGLVIVMFVQARLTPTTGDSTQQKLLKYGMPIMFGVFGFFFPAGLTLYIFTNTCLTAVHYAWMNKTDPAKAVVANASIVTDDDNAEPADKPQKTTQEARKRRSKKRKKRS